MLPIFVENKPDPIEILQLWESKGQTENKGGKLLGVNIPQGGILPPTPGLVFEGLFFPNMRIGLLEK